MKTDLKCEMQNADFGMNRISTLHSAIPIPNLKKEVNSMNQWKCSNCGYTFEAETVPDRCPSCKQACTFSDVTCYIPDCGGPGNIDPRLAGKKDKPINK
jgi:rubredoxin